MTRTSVRLALRILPPQEARELWGRLRRVERRVVAWRLLTGWLYGVFVYALWLTCTLGLVIAAAWCFARTWWSLVAIVSALVSIVIGAAVGSTAHDGMIRRRRWLRRAVHGFEVPGLPPAVLLALGTCLVMAAAAAMLPPSRATAGAVLGALAGAASFGLAVPISLRLGLFLLVASDLALRRVRPLDSAVDSLLRALGQIAAFEPLGSPNRAFASRQLVQLALTVEKGFPRLFETGDATSDYWLRQELSQSARNIRWVARQLLTSPPASRSVLHERLLATLADLVSGRIPQIPIDGGQPAEIPIRPRFLALVLDGGHTLLVAGLPLGVLAVAQRLGEPIQGTWLLGASVWAVATVISRSETGRGTLSAVGDRIMSSLPGLGGR